MYTLLLQGLERLNEKECSKLWKKKNPEKGDASSLQRQRRWAQETDDENNIYIYFFRLTKYVSRRFYLTRKDQQNKPLELNEGTQTVLFSLSFLSIKNNLEMFEIHSFTIWYFSMCDLDGS